MSRARTCGSCAGQGEVASDDGFVACVACAGAGAVHANDDDDDDDDAFALRRNARRMRASGAKTRADAAAMAVLECPVTWDRGGSERALTSGTIALMYFGSNRCGACRVFAPTLAAFAKKHAREGVVVVAISCDDETLDVPADAGFARLEMSTGEAGGERRRRVNAALRALDVNLLPTLAVVHRGRGEVLTTWGRTVLSLNPNGAMEQWLAGASGLDPFATRAFAGARRALLGCAYGGR